MSSNPFYHYKDIAKSGDSITDIENGPSINDLGNVAFVAKNNGFETIFVGNEKSKLTDITKFEGSNRNFFGSVEINNLNQVVARDFIFAGSPLFNLRVWDGNKPGKNDIAIKSSGITFTDFSHTYNAVGGHASINNNSEEVVAVAFKDAPFGGPDTVTLVKPDSSFPDLGFGSSTEKSIGPSPLSIRPQIADNGKVVLRNGNDPSSPIILYDENLSSFETISSGFTSVGRSPGISDDGQIVVFYGEKGKDKGIFASIAHKSGRKEVKIAGLGDGFSSFDVVDNNVDDVITNVAVNSTQDTQRAVTVVYMAKDKSGNKGIYSSRLNFFGDGKTDFNVKNSNNVFSVSRPTLVAEKGTDINGVGKVADLNIYDPVNNRDRGDIAFWVDTTANIPGGEAIVRARPQEVVYLDFDPVNNFSAGLDAGADKIFKDLGISAKWFGNIGTVFSQLAPNRSDLNVNTIQTEITKQVQQAFIGVGINVKVLSGNSAPTDGRFTRVYIGDSPYSSAKPDGPEGVATAFDLFNQDIFQRFDSDPTPIPLTKNDTALVFVDNIFRSTAYTDASGNYVNINDTGSNKITPKQIATAIANTVIHEIGHTFGLLHLNDSLGNLVMNEISGEPILVDSNKNGKVDKDELLALDANEDGKVTAGEYLDLNGNGKPDFFEFNDLPDLSGEKNGIYDANENLSGQSFGTSSNLIAEFRGTKQHDEQRLAFTVGSNGNISRTPPGTDILKVFQRDVYKLGVSLNNISLNVTQAAIGIVPLGEFDALPEFIDLGSGDLATLLDIDIDVTSQDQIILVASTDGNGIDIVGVPTDSGIDVSSIDLSNGLFVATNEALRSNLFDDSGQPLASSLDLFQITPTETVQIGTVGSEDAPPPTNNPPQVANDIVTTDEDTAIAIDALANDSDPDSDPLTLSITTTPNNGNATVNNNGTPADSTDDTITYTPDANFNGTDSFTYSVSDGTDTATATVTVNVTPVDDAPTVANPVADLTATENDPDTIIDLFSVFTDIDNDDAAITKTVLTNSNESLLTATIVGDKLTLDYLPNRFGTAEITIQGESNGLTVEDTFTVVVNEEIKGTSGRDVLTGSDKDEKFIGLQGRDLLTGNGGKDQFVYTSIVDAGDIITDFEVGTDLIILTELLESIDYQGSDAIADGYVQFLSKGVDTFVQIDPDGLDGSGRSRTFILVEDVTVAELNNPDNFIF